MSMVFSLHPVRVMLWAARVGLQDFSSLWSWKQWLTLWLLRVLSSALTWIMLGYLVGNPDVLIFLVIGQIAHSGAATCAMAIPAATWDRMEGTYGPLVASPIGPWPSGVGRAAIWLLNGIATSIALGGILLTMFGIWPEWARCIWLFLFFIPVCCTSAFFFSLTVGAVVNRVPATRNVAGFLVPVIFLAFSGVCVDKSYWSEPVRVIATALPLTNGLEGMRQLVGGADINVVVRSLMHELAIAFVWLLVSAYAYRSTARSCRFSGNLEL